MTSYLPTAAAPRILRVLLVVFGVVGLYFSLLSSVVALRTGPRAAGESGVILKKAAAPSERSGRSWPSVLRGEATRSALKTPVVHPRYFGTIAGLPAQMPWFLWFASVVACAIVLRRPGGFPIFTYLFIGSTIALSVSFYSVYRMFAARVDCRPCVIAWLMNFGILAAVSLRPTSNSSTEDRASIVPGRTWMSAAAILFVPLVATLLLPILASLSPAAPSESAWRSPEEFARWLSDQPRVDDGTRHGLGGVVLLKYHDYECPPCRKAFVDYGPIRDKYSSQVTFLTRDFPLEPECNPLVPRTVHPLACEAAVAVRLARQNGRASQIESWLFDNQGQLTRMAISTAARQLGGVRDYDVAYPQEIAAIRSEIEASAAAKITGTPTLFLDGIRIPLVPAPFLEAAIQAELARQVGGASSGR